MARKAIVNKEIILSMLKEGASTQSIAERFNVSRQAIDLHRKDFIARGLLPDQRAVRTRKVLEQVAPQRQSLVSTQAAPAPNTMSLDEQIDLIIDAFNALKRLPQLEKEVETYKRDYEKAVQEIERLKEAEKKRLDQEGRWLLTQHQHDTNPG